jgi:hypothetical protein
MPRFTAAIAALLLFVAPLVSRAEEVAEAPAPDETPASTKPFEPGVLPGLVAVAPGLLLHGAGHWAAGDGETARTLLAFEGLGWALVAAGGVPLVATGASRRFIGPSIAAIVAGVGIFGVSALSDVYGSVTGGTSGTGGRRESPMVAHAGYQYVEDPLFNYHSFVVASVELTFGDVRLTPSVEQAADDPNRHVRGQLDWRLAGPTVNGVSTASTLEVTTALTWRDYEREAFEVAAFEASVNGRADLGRLSPTLRGSFAEGGLGWGIEAYTYDQIPGLSFGEDVNEMLLARLGWGVWIGQPGPGHGEVLVYYDHRRDTLAGGLPTTGIAAGFMGFFGLSSTWMITSQWGLEAQGQLGSANVAMVGIVHRTGGGAGD